MSFSPTSLYAATARLQPRMAHGRYARMRVAAMLGLLGTYYLLPWIEVGGHPLVLFDLPHRRFHVFGLTLLPQDLWLLTWLLVIAAVTLFLFTTLAGRLWCGYACPQTVWTEVSLWIERLVEGERHARLKLDAAPWGPRKLLRRGGRHVLWAAFSLLTGLSFVAYFVPARELFPAFFTGTLAGWALFWTLFYGFATWGNAGFLREQVCKYMCPYARFQSAMFDRNTLLIAYDEKRGEPRKSEAKRSGGRAGDCVDCSLCVQVCPAGIDIRKGLQYECIACAACVDACDNVMDSVGKPSGLIRYTSSARENGEKARLMRPRSIAYGVLWLLLCAGFVAAVVLRTPLQLDVLRDRHSLYRELPDGRIENLYTVKLANSSSAAHRYRLEVRDSQGRSYEADLGDVVLAPGELRSLVIPVRASGRPASAVTTLQFTVTAVDAPEILRSREVRFLSGASS